MPTTRPVAVHHRREAEPLARHLEQALGERRLRPHGRQVVAAAHDVRDVQQQAAAERAARVRAREVRLGEPAVLEQRDRERVAHRERRRRARGRGEVERAGLGGHADVEVHVRLARERRGRVAGHRDEARVHALEERQDREQLRGLARVGDREHDVALRDHAEVAVAGLGRVQEERRRAGAGERRGDLAADVARLAHPGDDHAAAAGEQHAARLLELAAQAVDEGGDRAGLDPERLPSHLDQSLAVGGVVHRVRGGFRVRCGIIHRPSRCP